MLRNLQHVRQVIKNANQITCSNLHFLLYGQFPSSTAGKRKILSFSGFDFEIDSEEYHLHLDLVSKSLSTINLTNICKLFSINYVDYEQIHELVDIILKHISEISKSASVEEKSSRSKNTSSVRYTIRSKTSLLSETHKKLITIQDEVTKYKEQLLEKQEIIINLESEIEELKLNPETSERIIKTKEHHLTKEEKLLKIYEERILNKEKQLNYQEEIFKMGEDESQESISSFEEKNVLENHLAHQERVREWANSAKNQNSVEENSFIKIALVKELTNSISNLIRRQTVSNKLRQFDGSSCLEWPIFYSQYKLSNEACSFTPAENVLRLNDSLIGEARNTVSMLLISAQKPDDIIDILNKKYGRPELITEELLSTVYKLSLVENVESLIHFSSVVRNINATIKEGNLDNYVETRSILRTLVNKLPAHLLTQWGSYLIEKKIESCRETLDQFSFWVQQMSDTVSRITFISDMSRDISWSSQKAANHNATSTVTNKAGPSKICKICKKHEHNLEQCSQFQEFDVQQRWKEVKKHQICFSCLKKHGGKCRKRKTCEVSNCDRYHHRLLHKNTIQAPNVREVNTCTEIIEDKALLKVLPVKLKGPNGIITITALLDEGSTTTLIDAAVAAELGLSGITLPLCFKWTGEISRYDPDSKIVQADIANKNSPIFHKLQNIRTVSDLNLPWQPYDLKKLMTKFSFISNVGVDFENHIKPTLLIGQNNAHLIVSRQTIQPYQNGPILSKTLIGWVLHGCSGVRVENQEEIAVVCCESCDEKLHEIVKFHMKLESFGVVQTKQTSRHSKEEERALSIIENSIKCINGQFEVQLPWKKDDQNLPESKRMAMQRLFCLERRLEKDKEFGKRYTAEMQKLLNNNYAVPVSSRELQKVSRIWYLPHFPVVNPNKPGKVRIVFDAAARNHGNSLNDFILTGPDLLSPLFGVLLRFRIHKIAFAGDIKEMFNRINISYEDSFAQCFLWRDLEKKTQIKIYRMKAMLFGTTSSPFIAQFVKNYNAKQFEDVYPKAVSAIVDNHYVDDWLEGTSSEEEATTLINEVINIHARGGFEIRNFISNSKVVLQTIPNHLKKEEVNAEVNKDANGERILGMMWNSQTDSFNFNLKLNKVPKNVLDGSSIPTKRQVLKTAMSIYDPLGLLSPLTIRIRILLQTIWRSAIGWDDGITNQMFQKWLQWLQDLKETMQIEIPRCYCTKLKESLYLELHTFVDASEEAYSSICYLRIILDSSIQVTLVAAKARVAPLKTLTIPKLELIAAVMGTRLSQTILENSKLSVNKKYFWSDSKTVLRWLHSDKKLQTFVAARVGEILETTTADEWRWVPSEMNIADVCTRSTSKDLLNDCWFQGPKFLYDTERNWPRSSEDFKINFLETSEILMQTVELKICISEALPEIKSHYSWLKLLRVTARIKHVLNMLKKVSTEANFISTEDLKWSEKMWWKLVQCSSFKTDLTNLQNKSQNTKGRLRKHCIYLDEDRIIRLSSRTSKINKDSFVSPDPVVLDGSHPYTQKLILYIHAKNAHQGMETVINSLKRTYYIPKIRSVVKKNIRLCQICHRKFARPVQPKMGLLPKERLQYYKKPFWATGIDYFGPFQVKVGRRLEKRYGVLFTCLTVRAVHVEIAHSLSTDSCIMAIRRFLSRRGAVNVIMSDNASNFKGSNRELLEALDELQLQEVAQDMAHRGINWKYNSPLSPWQGGSWERLIGCFKRALSTIMSDRHPTDEVLQTLFAECEYILNNRPLTHVSDDPNDKVSITPNDILIMNSGEIVTSPGVFSSEDLNSKKQWRVAQILADLFWKRWLKEYLATLTAKSKWNQGDKNLEEGDVVIINENDFPRGQWPLGIITKVYQGEDNIVRVVEVKTNQGNFKRPARKLFRLNGCVDDMGINTEGDYVAK